MRIELHGDSTQVGQSVWSGVTYQEKFTPAKVLESFLGDSATVKNLAIGGSQLAQVVNGSSMYPTGSFGDHIAQSDADIIVCNWGINDAFLPGNTNYAHRQRWKVIERMVREAGKTLVIETPNPISTAHAGILASIVAASRSITGAQYVDIHAQVTWKYPQWAGHLSDGIHPNAIMYQFIGTQLFGGLKGLGS